MNFSKNLFLYIKKNTRLILELSLIFLDYIFIKCKRKKNENTVAIVRLDKIGDFVLWLSTAKYLRISYPDKKIVLIANSSWEALAKKFDYWDEVYSIKIDSYLINPLYRYKIISKINSYGFEVAVQPVYSRNVLTGDSVIRATRANKRVGSTGDLFNSRLKKISDLWYTKLISQGNEVTHELNRNFEFLKGYSGIDAPIALPFIDPLSLARRSFFDGKYCVISPGASWNGKRWPLKNYIELASKIENNYGLKIIIVGTNSESELGNQILQELSSESINLAGRTNLCEYIEVIRKATLVIGNDSSAIHISAAVRTPSIVIMGGGHFGRFFPYPSIGEVVPKVGFRHMKCYGCNWNCYDKRYIKGMSTPCISDIDLNTILTLVDKTLQN